MPEEAEAAAVTTQRICISRTCSKREMAVATAANTAFSRQLSARSGLQGGPRAKWLLSQPTTPPLATTHQSIHVCACGAHSAGV